MPRRVVRTRAGDTWTEARYFSFIRSALRKAWSKYPVRYQVLNEASRPYKGTDKRRKKEYQCASCNKWFMQKEVEVDHIKACGSLQKYADLPRFVETLFCEIDNLRVVCKPCHKDITAKERAK